MTTKLTLSVDDEVIRKAKQVSRKRGKSLSKIVEDYLKNMSLKDAETETLVGRLSSIMEPYRNKLKLPVDINYKEIVRQSRYNDYINKLKG